MNGRGVRRDALRHRPRLICTSVSCAMYCSMSKPRSSASRSMAYAPSFSQSQNPFKNRLGFAWPRRWNKVTSGGGLSGGRIAHLVEAQPRRAVHARRAGAHVQRRRPQLRPIRGVTHAIGTVSSEQDAYMSLAAQFATRAVKQTLGGGNDSYSRPGQQQNVYRLP